MCLQNCADDNTFAFAFYLFILFLRMRGKNVCHIFCLFIWKLGNRQTECVIERERERKMGSDSECGNSMNHPPSVCNGVFMTVFCYFDFHPLYSTASWVRVIYWSIDGSCYVHYSFKTSCNILSAVVFLNCLIPNCVIIFKFSSRTKLVTIL